MKSHLALWMVALLASATALGANAPYKEVMKESVRSKQPTVYARAAEFGYGVQYWRTSPTGSGIMGGIGSLLGGFGGQMAGIGLDRLANSGPTELARGHAERLAPLFDQAAAQRELESALAETLRTSPLFETPVVVKPLAGGSPTASTFTEDPTLVVELYSSLITDYRGLQVTALVYEVSAAERAAAANSSQAGRVYRNRFDYVSDLLPAPPAKSEEEIDADVEAVKAKYQGRRLTRQEQDQRSKELQEAKKGTTFEKWTEALMQAWLANGGEKLHVALRLGTTKVVELLARDLLDVTPVEIRKVDRRAWRTFRDAEAGRYTSIFVGGPFAGALISEPSGLSVEYCQGAAFSESLPKDNQPKLCAQWMPAD